MIHRDQPDREEATLRWLVQQHAAIAAQSEAEFAAELPSDADEDRRRELVEATQCLRVLEDLRRERTASAGTSDSAAAADATPAVDEPGAGSIAEAPRRIGRFEIKHELGRGGAGVVFLAFDPSLRRQVALKVPRPEGLMSPDLRRRFLSEAEAAARLSHPNLIAVYEVGHEGPVTYLAAEYCRGPNLSQWIKSRTEPPAPRDVAALFRDVAHGVAHAHSRGVLHRDLKPSNVLLFDGSLDSESGTAGDVTRLPFTPKIADFGLAKLIEQQGDATRSGVVLGTTNYMAPEQAEGRVREIGVQSDIFSIGVMLYEVLCGRHPFRGATEAATISRLLVEEPTPPRRIRGDIPADLQAICMKCLEKRPSRRYQTARELADELTRFLNSEPIVARPVGVGERIWKSVQRRPGVATLTTALALATVIGTALLWRERARTLTALDRARAQQDVAEKNADQYRLSLRQAQRIVDEQYTQLVASTLLDIPGSDELRRELLQDALDSYQQFVQQQADDPDLHAELAAAHFRIAEIQSEMGSAEWLSAFQEAVAIVRRLVEANANTQNWESFRAGLMIGSYRGEFGPPTSADTLKAAIAALDDAIEVWGTLTDREPGVIGFQSDLAAWCLVSAVIRHGYRSFYDDTGTVARLRRAEEIWQRLADDDPDGHGYRVHLSYVYQQLGGVHQYVGEHADANQAFLAALRHRKALAAESPLVPAYREMVQRTQELIGHLHAATDRHEDAVRAYEQSVEILRNLVDDYPYSRDYLEKYLIAAGKLVKWYTHIRAHDEAAELKREAATIEGNTHRIVLDGVEQTLVEFPRDGDRLSKFVSTARDYGALLNSAESYVDSAAVYRRCIDAVEKLADEFDGVPEYVESLANLYIHLGYSYWLAGADTEAVEARRRAVQIYEESIDDTRDDSDRTNALAGAYSGLARALSRTGAFDEAIDLYQQSLGILEALAIEFPDERQRRMNVHLTYRSLAPVERRIGRYDEAEQHYRQSLPFLESLVRDFPDFQPYPIMLLEWHRDFGHFLYFMERYEKAESAFRNSLEVRDKLNIRYGNDRRDRRERASLHRSIGETVSRLGRYAEAEESLSRAIDIEPTGEFYWHRGRFYLDWRRYDEAMGDFDTVIELGVGRRNEALKDRGQLYEYQKEYDRAVADYNKATEISPSDAETYLRRARLRAVNGEYDEAVSDYKQTIAIKENHLSEYPHLAPGYTLRELASLHYVLGTVHSQTGREDEAETSYNEALAMQEDLVRKFRDVPADLAQLAFFIAACPSPQFRDPSRAVELAQRAADAVPSNGEYWCTLGIAYLRADDWAAALEAFETAIACRYNHGAVRFYSAIARWHLGEPAKAREEYSYGIKWMEQGGPIDIQLIGLRSEARMLLQDAGEVDNTST